MKDSEILEDTTEAAAKTILSVLRDGRPIRSHPEPGSLAQTTGWVTYNASMVCLRYFEDHPSLVKNKRCGDLSSGNGLIAIALSLLGASHVMATEVTLCLALTQVNVDINALTYPEYSIPTVKELFWGSTDSPFSEEDDLIVACDLLFIAIRDGLLEELASTLKQLVSKKTSVLFCFEERIPRKENRFMEDIATCLRVHAIPKAEIDLSVCQDDDDESGLGLFYEPPGIHMFLLQEKTTATETSEEE
jgi:predicted nicotinamide N-methyase